MSEKIQERFEGRASYHDSVEEMQSRFNVELLAGKEQSANAKAEKAEQKELSNKK